MERQQLLNDYKKWLFYSLDNQGFDNHYNLHKALETSAAYRSVSIAKSDDNGVATYRISVDGISDELEISETQRRDFLKYLKANYLEAREGLEALRDQKVRESDINKNHSFLTSKNVERFDGEKKHVTVKPHPKEKTYYNIQLFISVVVYLLLMAVGILAAMVDASLLFKLLYILPAVGVFMLLKILLTGVFVGLLRGSSIRITREQFPEIYEIISEQAEQLKVKLPEIYITHGHFNSFVMKFLRSHILLIYSEVVETALHGDYDVLKYVTAHELCHIKQKHLTKQKWLFPARMIPLLGLAYSRGCEYTCDRIGYEFSPKGSVAGILIMTTGKEIYSKFNVQKHIDDCMENENFWTWLSEKFLTHPHPYKRLIEIRNYSEAN
jgi:Zn-dependent protease with chaperone function